MSSSGISPKSAARGSLLSTYRARGHRVANLWLVYSVKTNRDWVLSSDRRLVHWLYYLETNPSIASFDLDPDHVVSPGIAGANDIKPDAIAVYENGNIEWHVVKANKLLRSQQETPIYSITPEKVVAYRRFDDDDFEGTPARVALRWLKPIAYAEVIRDEECIPHRTALIAYCSDRRSGTIAPLLSDLRMFDTPTLLGVFTRLVINGALTLDLHSAPFGPRTRWSYDARD